MKVVDTYFCRLPNGTMAWLAVGKPAPADAEILEIRPMIMPDNGMILRNKETGEESSGHWMRDGDSADNWAEEPAPEIESIDAQKND